MSPSFAVMLAQFLNVVSWIVLIRVLLSWVIQDPSNPIFRFFSTLTDPILRPLSRFLTFGGLDLSPIVVFLIIRMIQQALLASAGA